MTKDMAMNLIENVMGSHDVQEMLFINRSRLFALIESGRLSPIKELKRESLFWKPDVEALKKELLLDSRTNLYKNLKGEKVNAK